MDIFVIEVIDADNVHKELLKEFQKKDISNPKKWNEHCLSYLMVDRILREFYKIDDREVVFDKKKPLLKSGAKHFSISHTEKYIALAFSDVNCGIDIEEIKQRSFDKVSERMGFTANTLDDFYYEWTAYEAGYKLGFDPRSSKAYNIDNHIITAVSENQYEQYDIYIQSPENK